MRLGAIVLCGGKSSRMGRDKATLPFGPEAMLQRVVRIVGDVVPLRDVVVVAAAGQTPPPLPAEVRIVHDEREGNGPLEGLAAGLAALGDSVDAAYATACDAPLLTPAFIQRMFDLLGDHDVVVPRQDGFHHPLAAVYRPCVAAIARELIAAGRMRPLFLFERRRTREIDVETLRDVDPELASLRNCNRQEDYVAALATAGLSP